MMKTVLTSIFLLFITTAYAQNYDESKVPTYTLPDPLITADNKPVTDINTWEKIRRPQLLQLFEEHIYGVMPKDFDQIRFEVIHEDAAAMAGKARLKQVRIIVTRKSKTVKIDVTMFIPNNATQPSPVFLLINNRGKDNTDPTRKVKSPFWPAEMAIDSGFAIAAFHVSDLAPDNKETYTNGVLQLYPYQLAANNGMRAIGAWAWGASRVMDYFQQDPMIDPKKVAIVGHSRGGKTSLWAAAQDQRFSICISNNSGNTGAALARRQFGERISRINTTFPHWFNNNYKQFNDKEDALPVDQHELIALIAPRPVYLTNASEDLWADPKGTFLAAKHAAPVYALYGLQSALPAEPPALNTPLIKPPLAYHNRKGVHDMTSYDWTNFIRFAKVVYKQ